MGVSGRHIPSRQWPRRRSTSVFWCHSALQSRRKRYGTGIPGHSNSSTPSIIAAGKVDLGCASALHSRSRHNTCCGFQLTGEGRECSRYCRLPTNIIRVEKGLVQFGKSFLKTLFNNRSSIWGRKVAAVYWSRTFREGGLRIVIEPERKYLALDVCGKYGCCLKASRTCFENRIYACFLINAGPFRFLLCRSVRALSCFFAKRLLIAISFSFAGRGTFPFSSLNCGQRMCVGECPLASNNWPEALQSKASWESLSSLRYLNRQHVLFILTFCRRQNSESQMHLNLMRC